MKVILPVILISLFICVQANAAAPINPGPDGVRFNKIEIYRAEKTLQHHRAEKDLSLEETRELDILQTILKTGKRAVTWFAKVNESRTPETRMDLSKQGTSKGMPITEPNKTNTTILSDRYKKILADLPPSISSVVTDNSDLPANAPIADEDFIKAIRTLDVLYQHAIRWIGQKDYLSWYINRSLWDIRGFYFLKQIPDLQNKLNSFSTLSADERSQLSSWLLSLCHNGDFEDSDCKDEFQNAVTKNRLFDYYNRFNKYGQSQYSSFFSIPKTRPEIFWSQDADGKNILHSPFLSPPRSDVQKWLAVNVEDEWKGSDFQLKLDFASTSKNPIPHIEFQSGVTAHVNDIAGDTITMDGDYSIDNYDQRWTIRHEYGHVLGFVDCYLEFYDVNEKAIIYYEIDIDNLMCSRHGKLQTTHIEGLKNAYKKNLQESL